MFHTLVNLNVYVYFVDFICKFNRVDGTHNSPWNLFDANNNSICALHAPDVSIGIFFANKL